ICEVLPGVQTNGAFPMDVYHPIAPATTPLATREAVKTVTGQFVARAGLHRQTRARWAAAASLGSAVVFPLTVKQAAALFGVPVLAVTEARKRHSNGKRHRSGKGNGKPAGEAESLAAHIARSSPAERVEAAQAIGLGVIWDTMISPACDQDRARAPAA